MSARAIQRTRISDWIEKNCADENLRYLFYERSGMCLADGADVETADEIAFRAVFQQDFKLNYDV